MSFICSCKCDLYFFLFDCMSTGGKKVVSILDIPLPELELELKKAYFCRT